MGPQCGKNKSVKFCPMTISSILFICLGNICRSPLAEGVFRDEAAKRGLINSIDIDSAGTGGWHVGDPPDPRSIDIAARHGIDIAGQTCRRLIPSDFHDFDLILAMDKSNVANAQALNINGASAQISLFMEFSECHADYGDMKQQLSRLEIPDPYYSGHGGFEIAYQMIRRASIGTLDRLFGQVNV